MKDKLKEFIDNNRPAFDTEPIPGGLFEKIMAIPEPGRRRGRIASVLLSKWTSIAAAVLVTGTTLYLLWSPVSKPASPRTVETESAYRPDAIYARQIDRFQEVIGLQQQELVAMKKEYPDLYREFSQDFLALDSVYEVLKTELAGNPNRETLLEAMIENLQLQSELLSRQLQIIKEIKTKNISHEKTRS